MSDIQLEWRRNDEQRENDARTDYERLVSERDELITKNAALAAQVEAQKRKEAEFGELLAFLRKGNRALNEEVAELQKDAENWQRMWNDANNDRQEANGWLNALYRHLPTSFLISCAPGEHWTVALAREITEMDNENTELQRCIAAAGLLPGAAEEGGTR